eukprot:PITA_04311
MQGPGRCSLCKAEAETINHLFLTCPAAKNVWVEVGKLMNKKIEWVGENLPEDKESLASSIAIQSISIFQNIPEQEENKTPRQIREEQIKEGIPWAYFDGASQNNRAGAGMIIHVNANQSIKASVGLRTGSNNYAEMSALKLLLCWLIQRNIFTIQIFGDSLNVINWVIGKSTYKNYMLKTLLEDLQDLQISFNSFSLCHIYREGNESADKLSKEGLQQNLGSWKIVEEDHGQIRVSDQPPHI